MSVTLFFLAGLLVWGLTRWLTWPLPEWIRRSFWVAVLALLLAPNLAGAGQSQLANLVLWPLAAGLAFAEVGVVGGRDRLARWKTWKADREARQAALKAQHTREQQTPEAPKRARRSSRSPRD